MRGSAQRRRTHFEVQVWHRKTVLDGRGNRQVVVDLDTPPQTVRAAISSDRSSRAEVPGQQVVEVYNLLVGPEVVDLGLWGLIRWGDDYYDVANPPAFRPGSPQTRHWTVSVRLRPKLGADHGELVIDNG